MQHHKSRVSGLINLTLYALLSAILLVIPYIAVLRYGFPITVVGDTSVSALSKDLFYFLFILLGSLLILSRIHQPSCDKFEISLIAIITYSSIRLIITTAELNYSVASFRHEILFIIFSLILYRLCITNIISPKRVDSIFSSILIFNFIIIVMIGYIEIFNKDILSTLYGSKSNSLVLGIPGMPNIRTVSTLENPINLALFLTASVVFFIGQKPRQSLFPFICCLFALPIVISTLSRLFTLIYIFVLIGLIARLVKSAPLPGKILLSTFLLASLLIFLYGFYGDFSQYISLDVIEKRIEQSLQLLEDKDDPRFRNWELAFNEVLNIPLFGVLVGLGLGVSNPGDFSPGQFRIENTFLTVFIQFGLIGFIIFFFPFLLTITWFRRLHSFPTFEGGKFFYFILIIMLGGISNDTHRNMPFSLYLWISTAMVAIFARIHLMRRTDGKTFHW